MSDETVNIKIDTLKPIFEIAQTAVPDVINDETLYGAIIKIKQLIGNNSDDIQKEPEQNNEIIPEQTDDNWEQEVRKAGFGEKRSILVVDDIGVVTYQLKILFQKAGYEVETAKDIFSAIKLIRKYKFSFIVMDLYVSTEREGFLLLDESKKYIVSNGLDTKIVVITASNKSEHKIKCMNRGADMFLQKDLGWQESLFQYVDEN